MRFKRGLSIEKGYLDVAPLIDVIFLLLIFFMLTSSFIFQPGIRVDLPKAVTSEVLRRELFVVTITSENAIFIDGRHVRSSELVSHIAVARREKQPLLIKADKGVELEKVVEVWDICRKLGIRQVNIATSQ